MTSDELQELVASYEESHGPIATSEIVQRDFSNPNVKKPFMQASPLPEAQAPKKMTRARQTKRALIIDYLQRHELPLLEKVVASTGADVMYIRAIASEFGYSFSPLSRDRRRSVPAPKKEIVQVILANQKNLATAEICEWVNVHPSVVRNVAKDMGYQLRRSATANRKTHMKDAVLSYDAEHGRKSRVLVAAALGCTAEYVRRIRHNQDKELNV